MLPASAAIRPCAGLPDRRQWRAAWITRQIDEAIDRDNAAAINPDAQIKAWGEEIAVCDRKRAAFQDRQAAGHMTLDELGEKLSKLDATKATVQRELEALTEGRRLEDLNAHKRFVVETFGQGIRLGLVFFPPQLRRQLYELLRLKITVYPAWEMRIEMDMDANVMRLTKDLGTYARKIREADRRIDERLTGDENGDEWAAVIEEKLDRVKREMPLLNSTDKVMAEVAG